ncbi:MAG: tRNA threonylcarbamoyladenosine biosynthesis protein TsaB [Acidobacteriota bacterium]|jgi:tRNA threonylcarbamoyladenosine biosynthesis protein TsaB|nr:tRNA threonylcarbamoyladenosine biosynthesis protein TsaB [Acidobacteriota bacterium]
MSLLLAIETSSDEFRIVLGREGRLIFDSAGDCASVPPGDLAGLVSCGLGLVNAQVTEIMGVALNIGPGGLSYIRAGVSFVNALAFSLGVRIYPFNYFEIIARQSHKLTASPVLTAVPAANDNAYVSLTRGTSVEIMRFGPLHSVVAEVSDKLSKVAVAGRIRHRLAPLLNGVDVFDTGIEKPDASILLELGFRAREGAGTSVTQVSPLNDQSEIFYE